LALAGLHVSGPVRGNRRRRLVSWRFREKAGAAIRLEAVQRGRVACVEALMRSGELAQEPGECICGASAGDVIARVDRYGLPLDTVLCENCATLRFDPYLTPSSLNRFYVEHYQEMYARVPDPDAYFERQRGYAARVIAWLRRSGEAARTIIEVGCGAGGALGVFAAAGFTVHGCDLSDRLITHGRDRGVPNLYCGDLHELARHLDGRRAELVLMHHVFEHLGSPLKALEAAKSVLADGGAIVVAVPDVSRIEALPAPNGNLRLMLHLAHKYNYSLEGLRRLGARAGLQARLLDVEAGRDVPEMWLAFHTPRPKGNVESASIVPMSAARLHAHFRKTEWRYIQAAVVGKLKRWVRRFDT
jgi:SAM-dependent methyltransferase